MSEHSTCNVITSSESEYILFFTGYKTPSKRYKSYFPKEKFIFDPPSTLSFPIRVILTHSVGLVQALNYCCETKSQYVKIVAMDPPDISKKAINERFNTLADDLKEVYKRYLDNNLNVVDYNVHIVRNIKNINFSDKEFYKSTYYYSKDTHYPYEDKYLRDKIIEFISK